MAGIIGIEASEVRAEEVFYGTSQSGNRRKNLFPAGGEGDDAGATGGNSLRESGGGFQMGAEYCQSGH